MEVSYQENGDSRIQEILKQLQTASELKTAANTQIWSLSARRSKPADGPATPSGLVGRKGKPISAESPSLGKNSTGLFSWRAEPNVEDAIAKVALYLESQRNLYYPDAEPLDEKRKEALRGFYSASLLDHVRVTELKDRRVQNPLFFEEAKADGFTNLPDMAHRAVVTFLDVIVFNEKITSRHLFHGLVHAAQVQLLGRERYAELFVTGFLKARSYFLVPLKAHAFTLDTRYAEDPKTPFSVEEEVRRWASEDRY
jgi:hypothetical protein